MKVKAALLTTAISLAVTSGFFGTATRVGDTQTTAEKKEALHVTLLSDAPEEEIDFEPGAEVPVNVRVKNEGSETARVFVKVSIPQAEGAALTDGTKDPEVVSFTPGEDWTAVTDGVYFYEEELESGKETKPLITSWIIPHYDLSLRDGEVVTGELPVEELEQEMNQIQIQGYAIQASMKGTPEQLWSAVGGE